jgi:ketopantoate reductase
MHWRKEPKLRSVFHVKICSFGAGAIGSYLAVELSLAGHDVCAIARGPHLKAIQQRGGSFEGHHLESVDPGGRLWDTLGPERAISCVVHPAC